MAAMFLLPTVNCVSVSVKTNVGDFTEHLGSGVGDQINGNTVITREALSNAVWAASSTKSQSSTRGSLNLASDKSATDNNGNTALTHVGITNAKSYSYIYELSNMGSFAAAAEALDVTGAAAVNAYAKAYSGKVAGPDVSVSTTVSNGDLHGYNNMAVASANSGYAVQSFDSATGTIQCDSMARSLPSKWSSAREQSTAPEASISTKAVGTITNYEDSAMKSSSGTSIEQNFGAVGTFTSKSTAKTTSWTRTSDYGTKYDIDMQANIANSLPSVKGTLTYYLNPKLNVQQAVTVSKPGDLITLSAGKYDTSVPIKIDKQVTVRGQGITGSITNSGAVTVVPNSGGENYVNAKEVFIRADDFYSMNAGWQWLTDLTNSMDFSATYAVIPAWVDWTSAAQLTQLMDKNKIEIATHGLDHTEMTGTYQEQYDEINQATKLLTSEFWRPRTFVSPYSVDDLNTVAACEALGYHSISGNLVSGAQGINQFQSGLNWETDWSVPNDAVPHLSLSDFQSVFDQFYSSNTQRLTVNLHPLTYIDANGGLRTDDTNAFAQSIDYMKGKNVEFMTMDQAYKWDS
jgi:peptidoglycan/xylan/chitin deacetylase (PgdA/CDA1 family)